MDNWGIWKTIKIGFWLGIGFIVPQLVVMYSGTVLTVLAMPSLLELPAEEYTVELDDEADGFSDVVNFYEDLDLTKEIKLGEYTERLSEGHLHIIGSVSNIGEQAAGSIEIEAELLDAQGNFVYECSEYIGSKVQPGASENFLMKCGCSRESVPEYATISLRVVEASAF